MVVVLVGCASSKPVERLSQKDVQDNIIDHKDELGECVDEQRRSTPSLHGKVLLRFRILPTGEPRDVEPVTDGPAELLRCLAGVLSSVRFPAHTGDSGLITYPIMY